MGVRWTTGGRVKPRILQHEQTTPPCHDLQVLEAHTRSLLQALTPATPMDGGGRWGGGVVER